MPKVLNIPDPTGATITAHIATNAAGALVVVVGYPADPRGPEEFPVTELAAAVQANLPAFMAALANRYKARKGDY